MSESKGKFRVGVDIGGTDVKAVIAYGAADGVPWLRMSCEEKQGGARLYATVCGRKCRGIEIGVADIDEFLTCLCVSWRSSTANDISKGTERWSS